MLHLIYITRNMAKEAGLTHEGTLFGVPAWFAGENDEVSIATPKVPILHVWCWLADSAYEILSYFISSDEVIESPIKINNRI
jgi:hypothetical protein